MWWTESMNVSTYNSIRHIHRQSSQAVRAIDHGVSIKVILSRPERVSAVLLHNAKWSLFVAALYMSVVLCCTLGFGAVREYCKREERVLELVLWLTNGQASGADASTIPQADDWLVIISPLPVSIPDLWQRWWWCCWCCCCCWLTTLSDWLWAPMKGTWLVIQGADRSISIPVQCMCPANDLQCQRKVHRRRYFVRNQIREEFFCSQQSKRGTRSPSVAGQIVISANDTSKLLQKLNWSISWDKEHDWVFGAISASITKSEFVCCKTPGHSWFTSEIVEFVYLTTHLPITMR